MAIREYIGARYVPRFTGLYDATTAYEPLDVVDNGMGTCYIARIPTPPNTPLTDTTYWFLYGASSGAIINLQNQVNGIVSDIAQMNTNTYVMHETGDDTARDNELVTALTTYDRILFDGGDFYFNGNIDIPNGRKLEGLGVGSRIHAKINGGYIFNIGNNVELESLSFIGTLTTTPSEVGAGECLLLSDINVNLICKITNCNFSYFSGAAIRCEDNGGAPIGSLSIENSVFLRNGTGIHNGDHGEYCLVNNCTFYQNFIGVVANGGNCRYTACIFGNNSTGASLNGQDIYNHGHGQFIGCSFNHNATALELLNLEFGEDITDCIFYQNTYLYIDINNSYGGIKLTSNNFGTNATIRITNNSSVIAENNVFSNMPSINRDAGSVHGIGNTVGDGTSVNVLNQLLIPSGSVLVDKTYNSNSCVTASDFNNNVRAYQNGSLLYIRFNIPISNLSSSYVTIGNLDTVRPLLSAWVDVYESTSRHYIVDVTEGGAIRLYGYNSISSTTFRGELIALLA